MVVVVGGVGEAGASFGGISALQVSGRRNVTHSQREMLQRSLERLKDFAADQLSTGVLVQKRQCLPRHIGVVGLEFVYLLQEPFLRTGV